MPLVSVLMTAFNAQEFINEAIESIINQSFTDFEFIIVDDASTDSTPQILKKFQLIDSRIKVQTNPNNLHIAASANIGLSYCKGKYIARMDSDDISLPERIEKQFQYLEKHPECIVCGSYVEFFGSKNSIWKMSTDSEEIKMGLIFGSPFANSASMIRANCLKDNLLEYSLDYKYPPMEDYYLWWQLHKMGDLHNIDEVLCKKREYSNSQTQLHLDEKEKSLIRLYKTVNEQFGLGLDINSIEYLSKRQFTDLKKTINLFNQLEGTFNKQVWNKFRDRYLLKALKGCSIGHKIQNFHNFYDKRLALYAFTT